ncbi:MAG TPA: BBP7 family outer membrane beta-barrel protein, partial [Lacipirellulaceae bacterium]|nr:BBP7 family outer membrane beta-barrel protein [Lacipirellulaceae bacterium]
DDFSSTQGYEPWQPNLHGLWTELAPIESTGTWLRRGFWYAETDAVIFNRMWNRKDKRYAAQDSNVNIPPIFDPTNAAGSSLGFNPLLLDTNRVLILNGALPGEDASVRGTLGTFLFRDDHNRDHTLEFTAFGGGNWEQDRELSSSTPNGLFVPWFIDGGNRSFDQSTSQRIVYDSNLDSFEMNYHVRERLGHDQLIMDPNGDWHRAANAGFEKEYLVGLRLLQLTEKLNWQAQDIVNVGDDGSYIIHTDNDMFGFQLGTGMTYQAPRWSLGATAKGGVFLNDALGRDQLNFTADDTDDADLRLRQNELSFVGEFKLTGRYHILPNVSLRAGYELLLITSAAIAPNQATFITDFSYLNTTATPFYHGASFGCEMYW